MKKGICLLLTAVFLLSALAGCAQKEKDTEGAVLSGTDLTVSAGERVVVPVVLSGMDSLQDACNGRLVGFQFAVSAPGLEIITSRTELSDDEGMANWTVDEGAQDDGSYMVMVVDMNLVGIEAAGDVEIARLHLNVPTDAAGEYTVTYSITDVCDSDANSAATDKISVQSSKITVKAE